MPGAEQLQPLQHRLKYGRDSDANRRAEPKPDPEPEVPQELVASWKQQPLNRASAKTSSTGRGGRVSDASRIAEPAPDPEPDRSAEPEPVVVSRQQQQPLNRISCQNPFQRWRLQFPRLSPNHSLWSRSWNQPQPEPTIEETSELLGCCNRLRLKATARRASPPMKRTDSSNGNGRRPVDFPRGFTKTV